MCSERLFCVSRSVPLEPTCLHVVESPAPPPASSGILGELMSVPPHLPQETGRYHHLIGWLWRLNELRCERCSAAWSLACGRWSANVTCFCSSLVSLLPAPSQPAPEGVHDPKMWRPLMEMASERLCPQKSCVLEKWTSCIEVMLLTMWGFLPIRECVRKREISQFAAALTECVSMLHREVPWVSQCSLPSCRSY